MHVVLVESNFSGISAIASAVQAGNRVTLLTHDLDQLIGLLPLGSGELLRLASEIIQVETTDLDAMERVIRVLKQTPDAVLTFSQPFTSITARLARRLNLKGACPQAVEIGRDKGRTREVLRKVGVDDVKFQVCLPSELLEAAHTVGFPLILKPNKGQGSINVKICKSIDEVLDYQSKLQNNGPQSVSSEILVEEFLDGPLFSVENFTVSKGQHVTWGVSDRVLTANGVEVAASFPVFHPQNSEMISLANRSLDAIGFDFGPSHVELILTSRGPKIVELNLRVGGSGMTQIMDKAFDRSVCLDIIKAFCGQPFEKPPRHVRAAAWCAAVTDRKWKLDSLPPQSVVDTWGMDEFWFHKDKGTIVGGIDSNFSWIAQSLASGQCHKTSMTKAREGTIIFLQACGYEFDQINDKWEAFK